jgi:P27 family predicted phage terminase small subunit
MPSARKQLAGTYRADRSARNEAQPPPPATLDCPHAIAMREEAAAEWNRLAPMLAKLRLFTAADHSMLLGYCVSYAKALDAEREVTGRGMVIDTAYGPKANPAVSMARNEWAAVRRFAQELGLTPSARSRISVPEDLTKADEAEDFLFGGLKVVNGGEAE